MKKQPYFSKNERLLWLFSALALLLSYAVFDRGNPLRLCSALLGVTSLLFNAKGHPFGQLLMIVFALLYGYVSYGFCYYGEMITYVGMTAPMALFALISWLKNPYQGNKSEVAVQRISRKEWLFACILTAAVTALFYFILKALHTENLPMSTVSVATSFLAVYLTFRRSAYFALAYAANDLVLIVLWIYASVADPAYSSVAVCFLTFLINDLYGFFSWKQRERKQNEL